MIESNNDKQELNIKRPLVFISHDTRDAEISEAFSKLLSSVSAGVLKSFRSSDKKGNQGIEYGVEWYPEIMKNLQQATSVVCLLTENSFNRPWILFEAGVAKGKLNTAILGVCTGIPLSQANSGPFAQFQNCGDDEESLTKLVLQLVKTIPNSEPDEQVIKGQVSVFKEKIGTILKERAKTDKSEVITAENSIDNNVEKELAIANLYEEMKIMLKDLPARIQSNLNSGNSSRKNRTFISTRTIDELIHYGSVMKMDTGIKIILSLCKNDFPWLYELGIEFLNGCRNSSISRLEDEFINFERILDITYKTAPDFNDDYFGYIFDRLHKMMRDYYEECMVRRRSKKDIRNMEEAGA